VCYGEKKPPVDISCVSLEQHNPIGKCSDRNDNLIGDVFTDQGLCMQLTHLLPTRTERRLLLQLLESYVSFPADSPPHTHFSDARESVGLMRLVCDCLRGTYRASQSLVVTLHMSAPYICTRQKTVERGPGGSGRSQGNNVATFN
jgi:hypothetical protein